MFKIKHISTGKYLTYSGATFRTILNYYPVEHWLAKLGKTWSTKKGTERTMKCVEYHFPGQFKVVEFKEK
jgi:hypothetical protein